MDHTLIAGQGREDRLSRLGDGVLGHILSFLDTKEAARATTLSSRWRDILASVHTVSMEEPEGPIPEYDHRSRSYELREPDPTLPFTVVVTAALFARSRRPAPGAASPPLRALRVSMESYGGVDAFPVDQWVTYAVKHSAPELEVDLRVRRVPICHRPYAYHPAAPAAGSDGDTAVYGGKADVTPEEVDYSDDELDDTADAASTDDSSDETDSYWRRPPAVYTVHSRLFSCATLRSLRLGSCNLSPPAVISLPSLEALHLTHVPDEEEHVQRLISASPHLADLTLEACATVKVLSLLDNSCLRRLIILCCHNLATVTVDAQELHAFEYRGAVRGSSFLSIRGNGGGLPSIKSCKIDVCAVCVEKEATSEEELAALGSFLLPFASTTKRLQLRAARMGSCFVALPAFPAVRHLQLNGRVLRDDDPAAAIATTCTILRRAPDLELLTLFFEPAPLKSGYNKYLHRKRKVSKFVDAHHLHYNKYDTVDYETAAIPSCLGTRVRHIRLWHYQGGRAQRTLARFLLCNARVLEELYCEFAEGPLSIQTKLMREMEGWVLNEGASKEFL
ncbi:uncharacterized protein [Lolium perenne]|uniref:uncharacterized protein n=1 Tax=Lolium perenne TaxID=4522 RepID=UPI0021F65A60|nr:uncharacterized protein LOC127340831 [Lolium perenne]